MTGTMQDQPAQTIRKVPNTFIESEIDDETIVVSLDTGDFFALKGTGLAIWRALDAAPTRAELLEQLAENFDASHERIGDDVDAFLQEVRQKGFVEPTA